MSAQVEQAAAAAASVLTPHRKNSGSNHPVRRASQDDHHDFQSRAPDGAGYRRRTSIMEDKERWVGTALTPMYVGIAALVLDNLLEIGLSIHDGTYTTDFSVETYDVSPETSPEDISNMVLKYVVQQLTTFAREHTVKFVGAGITEGAEYHCPTISNIIWKELDIVPIVFHVHITLDPDHASANSTYSPPKDGIEVRSVDEQADSAVRKALMYFGPNHNPRLTIGFRNQVEVDGDGKIHLVNLKQLEQTVADTTWRCVLKYANEIKAKKLKIAFFNSTPQGGGVALMRHAMMRFYKLLGIDVRWYVPKPNPAVFRITKNNHNILQGVNDPSVGFSKDHQAQMDQWITYNAERYWLKEGGPLSKGGADVIIIDDPQMPGLIPLIKKVRPDVPVIYRSHIEIRGDLVLKPNTAQNDVWNYLWDRIQQADVFLSHPVNKFVPGNVPAERVGLMGAATDWLDGLSKPLRDWDLRYYFHNFRTLCSENRMYKLQYPARNYIVQVARFDPSKGIPTVIESYVKLRKKLDNILPISKIPQLLICGHGAIDDPDASIIYDQVLNILEQPENQPYVTDIIVMRIPPSDQLLNALLSCAKVALQLSTREGFEVKVSEALHKGIPIIASRAGGIPLQVQHEKSGYLVEPGDSDAVARHLFDLWRDKDLYERMSNFAKNNVSDEVGTVGNSLAFMYMAAKMGKGGEVIKPNGRWINDMLREDAGEPYRDDEPRLPRGGLSVIV
ncbi:hypothetical protein TWF569_002427 [Orbilia oligospora]|uniref:Uncharacterized protein n=1 Tax=Orbilia oligospora TaxID=2813651 RepID=A0A7C8NWY8_ORBOL|nr:hypothetical protein TWF102_008224 [Orbilia oligospora]KAF3110660.1 hypothetical protein TWF102_008224 [Orbilia oligospora]KAF3114486.1 hypothetical protein TWF706_008402 [Orbilia oligospora]KAF3114487.1 hypothetical protein TWF706_008402 [Orbilia oligospora]KAF3114739.1 hypothetical protein TWF103_000477 [Orbilia oligospora]